jgi:dihydroflavonol-4-reductase
VTINPFMIIGPSIGPGLNTSTAVFRDILGRRYPGIMNLSWGFVDVRDVARAHVLAMASDRATGRYLCAGETLSMKEIVVLLRDAGYGDRYTLPRLDLTSSIADSALRLLSYTQPTGIGSYMRTHLGKVMRYDNGRIRHDLGLEFRPVRESVIATVEDLQRWGHLSQSGPPPAN